jgi:thermitase
MKLQITFLATILATCCFSQETTFCKNEIIVALKANSYTNKLDFFEKNKRLNKINDSLKLESSEIIGNKKTKSTLVLKFKNDVDIKSIIEVYKKTNLFEYVEPNYIGKSQGFLQTTPDDPNFNRQWSHNNDGTFPLVSSKNNADMDTDLAWDITQGDPNLIVAILDSGIKLGHPEFAGRIVAGYDFVNNDADPTDDNGHGTNVAGIALASGNNAIGYAGINWNSKIMPCKILDNKGLGLYSLWADAIYFAVDNGAKVINFSLGGEEPSILLKDAIDYAYDSNVSVVVAVGNHNSYIRYPAKYENAIAVGATNPNDTRSSPFFGNTTDGSNYGPELDFVAPGNCIFGLSYNSNTDYNYYWSGTSQAAPHVTGVISLLLSVNPKLTVDQIRQILKESSQDRVGDRFDTMGWDQYYGYGRINAYRAISNALLSNTEYYIESKNIKLFPNPITNENVFSISGLEANIDYQIKVIALDGKIVKGIKNNFSNGSLTIENQSMPSGIYLVHIYNANNKLTFIKKIIKQ